MVFEKLAANGYGLAMWWNLKIVRPEPLPNKNTKDEANKQKPNRIPSAETAADNELQPKVTTSSHTCSNTHVTCRFSSCRAVLLCLNNCQTLFRF